MTIALIAALAGADIDGISPEQLRRAARIEWDRNRHTDLLVRTARAESGVDRFGVCGLWQAGLASEVGMTAPELLLALARAEGAERLAVYWREDPRWPELEIARERRTADGWALMTRLRVRPSELYLLGDAIDDVCRRLGAARR